MLFRSSVFAVLLFVANMMVLPAVKAAENPVVARVDGIEIYYNEVVDAHKMLPKQYQQAPIETIYGDIVNLLIDGKLAVADARAKKLNDTDEFKTNMAGVEQQMLQRAALNYALERAVTDDAVKKEYDEMVKALGDKNEYHARHILVKEEAEAKEIIASLDKGADFIELAKEKSTGPSGPKGGDLGYFGPGQMVPEFETAAASMEKGAHSKAPVKTQFGWHVLKLEDVRPMPAPTLEQSRPQLEDKIKQQAGAKYFEGLRSDAKIEKFNQDGTPTEG